MRDHERAYKLDFLPYHFLLTSVGHSGWIKWQDVSVGQYTAGFQMSHGPTRVLKHNPINAVSHVGHNNGVVSLWSPAVGKPLVTMFCHKSPVTDLAVDLEGRYMATFDSDRFIGTWAVLLKHMKVDIVTDERSYPLPAETWQRVVASYQNGLLKRPELAFMLYGPADIAGMRPVGEQLPSAITGGGSSWRIERLMCERVVAGIGDGSIDEINTFPDLRNAWAVHVSDNEEVSVLLRHDIANSSSAYRRIAVVGRELAKVHPGLKNQICGLFQLGISALIDIEHTARALSTSQHQISNGLSHIAGTFREYLQRLVEGGQPGPEGVYNKSLSSKYCIPSDATDHELTPLREHVFLLDKMSKKKENRCWTRFEMLDVLVAT